MTVELVENQSGTSTQQFATFYVGDMLLGIDICEVREINRQLDITPIPRSPEYVRGVINLRGEVATVIDLRTVLGMEFAEETRDSRNLIVNVCNESIGLWVDRLSDILTLKTEDISPVPSNVAGIDGRFFTGVYTMESEIVLLLDLNQIVNDKEQDEA